MIVIGSEYCGWGYQNPSINSKTIVFRGLYRGPLFLGTVISVCNTILKWGDPPKNQRNKPEIIKHGAPTYRDSAGLFENSHSMLVHPKPKNPRPYTALCSGAVKPGSSTVQAKV